MLGSGARGVRPTHEQTPFYEDLEPTFGNPAPTVHGVYPCNQRNGAPLSCPGTTPSGRFNHGGETFESMYAGSCQPTHRRHPSKPTLTKLRRVDSLPTFKAPIPALRPVVLDTRHGPGGVGKQHFKLLVSVHIGYRHLDQRVLRSQHGQSTRSTWIKYLGIAR